MEHWSQSSRIKYLEGYEKNGTLISTPELCRRARVTYRMLNSWVALGVVTPAVESRGSGTVQRWFQYQVGEVIEIRELKREQRRLGDLIEKRRRSNAR